MSGRLLSVTAGVSLQEWILLLNDDDDDDDNETHLPDSVAFSPVVLKSN